MNHITRKPAFGGFDQVWLKPACSATDALLLAYGIKQVFSWGGSYVMLAVPKLNNHSCYFLFIWATAWQNIQKDLHPMEDSDQPGHPPGLTRVFAVRSMGSQGPKAPSCGQQRLLITLADAQADMSLRWMHRSFCWFCRAPAHFSPESSKCQKSDTVLNVMADGIVLFDKLLKILQIIKRKDFISSSPENQTVITSIFQYLRYLSQRGRENKLYKVMQFISL